MQALISTKLYAAITKACKWDGAAATVEDATAQWPGQCEKLQNEAHEAVRPHPSQISRATSPDLTSSRARAPTVRPHLYPQPHHVATPLSAAYPLALSAA